MSWMRIAVCMTLMSCLLGLSAQKRMSYKLLVPTNDFTPFGYSIDAGVSLSTGVRDNRISDIPVSNTTSYRATVGASSGTGFFVGGGGFYIPEHGPFRILSFSANFKQFKGYETVRAELLDGSDLSYPDLIAENGSFRYNLLSFHIGAEMMHAKPTGLFFHHGPGFIMEESLGARGDYEVPHLGLNTTIPERLSKMGLTYTLGTAFRVGPGSFIDIFYRTQLVEFSEQAIFTTSTEVFSSRFRGHTLGLRVLLVNKREDRTCPALSGNKAGGGRFTRKKPRFGQYPW